MCKSAVCQGVPHGGIEVAAMVHVRVQRVQSPVRFEIYDFLFLLFTFFLYTHMLSFAGNDKRCDALGLMSPEAVKESFVREQRVPDLLRERSR